MPSTNRNILFPYDLEEVVPTPEELEILRTYYSGDPEYQPIISQDEVLKELGLQVLKDTRKSELPESDETAVILEGHADRTERGTVSHDEINWD